MQVVEDPVVEILILLKFRAKIWQILAKNNLDTPFQKSPDPPISNEDKAIVF